MTYPCQEGQETEEVTDQDRTAGHGQSQRLVEAETVLQKKVSGIKTFQLKSESRKKSVSPEAGL